MKKQIIVFIAVLALTSNLFGQKGYENGFVVSLQSDTLFGIIKDRKPEPFPKLYKNIRFKKEGTRFKKSYAPDQIKGYKAGTRVYESVGLETESRLLKTRYLITKSSPKSFLKVVHRGKLSYYHWEYPDSESGIVDYIPLFHVEGRNEMVRVTQGILGLKRELLSEYFSDCPALAQKIEKREIRTPEEIIDFFGTFCGNSEKIK
jgi:hypothetical protein